MGKFRSQIRRSLPLDHVLVVSAEPAGRGDFYEKVPPTPPKTLFAGAEKRTQSWLLAILTFFHPAETKAAFPKDYQREIGSGSLPQVLPAFSKAVGCMGCGCPVETSAKQKYRPSAVKQVPLGCRQVRLKAPARSPQRAKSFSMRIPPQGVNEKTYSGRFFQEGEPDNPEQHSTAGGCRLDK